MKICISKKVCTGCGACSNICPKKAIKMLEDETGFKYPIIDNDLCVNCGLCKKTCPIMQEIHNKKSEKPEVYAAWSKDKDIRFNSTSGGAFTEIAKQIIKNNGYVIGAKYNQENLVEHAIVNNEEGLEELRQSKYLQSDTKNIYNDTKKILDKGNLVAFCGSPCQIAGLYKFLRKEYQNLLTIEFICRGMNSPKAYKAWLSEIENKNNKKVKKVWFKYKVNGWKASPKCTRIDFKDETYKVFNGEENLYMQGYLKSNLYIRPSCGNCKFNGLPRQADITLADFWGIDNELDDDKGTSLILINSDMGKKIVESIFEKLSVYKRDINEIYKGNVCFNNSVEINPNSKRFLKGLNSNNFSLQLEKYEKISILNKIFRKLIRIYKKIK